MYARIFRKAAHVKRFSISEAASVGWEVREEADAQIVKAVLYTDWHRVERAKLTFTDRARALSASGWVEC